MRTLRTSLALALVFTACSGPMTAPDVSELDAAPDVPLPDAPPDAPEPPGETVRDDRGSLTAFSDGSFTLRDARGLPVLERARADVLLGPTTAPELVLPANCAVRREESSALPAQARTLLTPEGPALVLRCEPDARLAWELYLQRTSQRSGLVARLRVDARANPLRVLRMAPVAVAQGRGALYVAGPVADDRALDNGSVLFADFTVRLAAGNRTRDLAANALPIALRGNILANTNMGLHDLGTGAGLAAGFLTAETGMPQVGLGRAISSRTTRVDGAEGYETFVTEVVYLPRGKPVAAASSLWSEWAYVEPTPASQGGHGALEGYADAVRVQQRITPWRQRPAPVGAPAYGPEGRRVPAVWQSWSLGYMGGYGSEIDQRIVRANVDFASRELAPYGFATVPMDDGWQRARGDWSPSPERFPEGLEPEVRYANERGLSAGFWVAPFQVSPASETARTHPEWIAALEPTLGPIGVPAGSPVLDLSRDDTVARVREVTRTMNALGLAWSKQDFTYHALLSAPARDDMTALEAYRRGWSAVREETRDGTFLLAVAIFGPNYGVADGIRTGLDTGGRWSENATDPESPLAATRSFKTVARTSSRRWYFNDRVAVLDPDAVTFRPQDTPSTIGEPEQRTFALFVAMLGGVVEVGDPLVNLSPFAVDTVRRIVPPYGVAARPLDVFTREYNERWVLPVRAWSSEPDAPAPWTVAAVTHWGANRDATQSPFAAMSDAARAYTFSPAELGLRAGASYVGWELFSNELVPVDPTAGLARMVNAHACAAVIVRERRAGAQLLGTDRHLTGGAVDVRSERWDESSRTLTVGLRLARAGDGGRTMPLLVAVRADATLPAPAVQLDGAAVTGATVARDGELVRVQFTPPRGGDAVLTVRFGG